MKYAGILGVDLWKFNERLKEPLNRGDAEDAETKKLSENLFSAISASPR